MHAGRWTFNPTGFEHWSPKLFQIHGLDPRGNAPTQKEYLALVHSEDGVRLGDHQRDVCRRRQIRLHETDCAARCKDS